MGLKVFLLPGKPGEAQRVCTAERGADRGHGHRHLVGLGVERRTGFADTQQIVVVGAGQLLEPGGPFLRGQAVEDGDRRRDVVSHIAQHGASGTLETLVVLRAKRQRLSEDQPDQKDQRQA